MHGRGLGRPLGAARGARTCERPGLQLRCARPVQRAQPAANGSGQCPHVPWARERARRCQGGAAAAARGAYLTEPQPQNTPRLTTRFSAVLNWSEQHGAVLRGVRGGVGKLRMKGMLWYEILIINYKGRDVGLGEKLVCSGGGCCRPMFGY